MINNYFHLTCILTNHTAVDIYDNTCQDFTWQWIFNIYKTYNTPIITGLRDSVQHFQTKCVMVSAWTKVKTQVRFVQVFGITAARYHFSTFHSGQGLGSTHGPFWNILARNHSCPQREQDCRGVTGGRGKERSGS